MEIKVFGRSKERREIIEKVSKFYLSQLNLDGFKHRVVISLIPHVCRDSNSNGYFLKVCDGLYQVVLDSRLEMTQCLRTLAHELVHVKQSARGHYQTKISRNGKEKRYWLGKHVVAKYEDQPWEREAFRREEELLDVLFRHIAQKEKKAKKTV
jgi:hypothetical protein